MAFPSPPSSNPFQTFSPVGGRNAHFFQPPKSPASLTTTPSYARGATSTDYFGSNVSRKRARPDSSHTNSWAVPQNDWNNTPAWAREEPTPSDGGLFGSAEHKPALVNERYRLNGGFDTPGLAENTDLDSYTNNDYESRRRMQDPEPTFISSGPALSGPLARDRNGVARMPSSPNGTQKGGSWTSFAFNIAGKVFSFGTNVIKGFYAGGGQGYELPPSDTASTLFAPALRESRAGSPLPGSWQADRAQDFLGDFEQDNPSPAPVTSSTRPSNKRQKTDEETWVLISAGTSDQQNRQQDTAASPKRKSLLPRPAVASTASARSSSPSRIPVSSNMSRRSLAASKRPSLHNTTILPHPASPSLYAAERRASVASTRSPRNSISRQGSHQSPRQISRPSSAAEGPSYLSPEAERIIKRQARQERQADRAMGKMSKQLEDLIRQGQQALGTRISVEGDDLDEGW